MCHASGACVLSTWHVKSSRCISTVKVLLYRLSSCALCLDTISQPSHLPRVHRHKGMVCQRGGGGWAYIYIYICIYIYIHIDANPPPPPWTTARCRETTNPPTFRLLVYDSVLKFRRESICMTAAAFILNSLRPCTQILREMINDESFCLNTRRSVWARVLTPKIAFTVVSDQSPSNTYEWAWALIDSYS